MADAAKTPRAVAFDWGGVFTRGTFDSSAVHDLAAYLGVSEDAVAEHYYPLMETFEVGAFDMAGFHRRFAERSKLALSRQGFVDTFLGAVRERTQMYRLLAAIPPGYRVAMLSNNVPVLCDQIRGDPRMARIEEFVFSNELGVRKPDPAAFAQLAQALAVPPAATVFVDDNAANIGAAESLGFRGIHFESLDSFARRWRLYFPDIPVPAPR